MKFFTKSSIVQKIVIAIIIVISFNFIMAPGVYAEDEGDWSLGGTIAKELIQFILFLTDVGTGFLNNMMLGVDVEDIMLSTNDSNIKEDSGSWLAVNSEDIEKANKKGTYETFEDDEIDTDALNIGNNSYEIPNMLYSPENIFSNNIAALDINFLNPNTYNNAFIGQDDDKNVSAASKLGETIASWYKSFRNIAIVGLLSVLIYLGIRILISSTAVDKAKYKESLKDWVVALCLVFFIHFIMAGILMLTDKVNELFSETINEGYIVKVGNDNAFRTNLMGLIRFSAQSTSVKKVAGFAVMYIAILIYTCIFTVMYLKRFLYTAFFTMIAPLVALTYPIDRAGDGKSQAFNVWFKEYTMNVIIQPVHLIIYTVFVSSAYDLAAENMIYALVAIGFLIPAEKFIKSMFGLNKAESTSGFGSFAGGALAMNALKSLSGGSSGKKSGGQKEGSSGDDNEKAPLFAKRGDAGKLNTFNDSNKEDNEEYDDYVKQMQASGWLDTEEENTNSYNQNNKSNYAGNIDSEESDNYVKQMKASGWLDNEDENIDSKKDDDYVRQMQASGWLDTDEENTSFNQNNPVNEKRANDNDEEQENKASNITSNNGQEKYTPKPKSNIETIGGIAKNMRKKAGRNKRKIIRGAARLGGKAVGAVGGTMVGLAAGITTGDMSKAWQYTAAGAAAGTALGSKAGNLVDGTVNVAKGVVKAADDISDAWTEEKYGYEKAKEKRDKRTDKRAERIFMNDEKNHKKYKQMAAEIGYQGDYEDLMKSAMDYEKYEVREDLIKKAIKLEAKEAKEQGISIGELKEHNQYVQHAARMTKENYDRSTMTDNKELAKMEENAIAELGEEKGKEFAMTAAKMTGSEGIYRKKSKYFKDERKAKDKKGKQNLHVKPDSIANRDTTNNS